MEPFIHASRVPAPNLPSIESVLAATLVASIPLGPALEFSAEGKNVSISFSQLITIVLVCHIINTKLIRTKTKKSGLAMALMLSSLMLTPLLISPVFGPGLFAFTNYALGILGGMIVGHVWARQKSNRLGIVDLGLIIFLLWGSAQLLNAFANAEAIRNLHQNAETPWGNSNYVAGGLIVGALILAGRALTIKASLWSALPVLIAITAALMTLSRGAAVAGAVGCGVLLWTAGSRPWHKITLRLFSVALPVAAYTLVATLEQLRYEGSSHANRNVDSRLALFQAAWEDFQRSPIVGSGWLSFRSISAETIEQQSFAHNFVLSFLQMGGVIFGLSTICCYIYLFLRAIRMRPLMAPAIFAGLSISMTDPFFEGTVGNVLILSATMCAIAGARYAPEGLETPAPTWTSSKRSQELHGKMPAILANQYGAVRTVSLAPGFKRLQ